MKIIVTTSTFPAHENDVVPRFVYDQLLSLKSLDKNLEIYVLIPHHSYADPELDIVQKNTHTEVRYHYFVPHSFESLTGRGRLPALKRVIRGHPLDISRQAPVGISSQVNGPSKTNCV